MLPVLAEFFIVKNCYKFCSLPTIRQSLVLTLLSWTQKVQHCLQILAFLGFTLPDGEAIAREDSSSSAPLNSRTLPHHPIDLDRPVDLALDYNFRHTCCYRGYNKRASFYSCFSRKYFWDFLEKPLFVLIKAALRSPGQRRLAACESRYFVLCGGESVSWIHWGRSLVRENCS